MMVIAVVGTLATMVFVSLQSARGKAHDTQRMKDMEEIQGAVELYYRDNGHYPITRCGGAGGASFAGYQGSTAGMTICSSSGLAASNSLTTALAPYLSQSLKDPWKTITGSTNAGYQYTSEDSAGMSYCIRAYATPENMSDFPSAMVDTSSCGTLSGGSCSGTNSVFISTVANATGC